MAADKGPISRGVNLFRGLPGTAATLGEWSLYLLRPQVASSPPISIRNCSTGD